MDLSNSNDPLLNAAIASIITVITIIMTLIEMEDNDRRGIAREPSLIREQWRQAHMYRILTAGPNNCVHYLRMSNGASTASQIFFVPMGHCTIRDMFVWRNNLPYSCTCWDISPKIEYVELNLFALEKQFLGISIKF
ncbi:Uncharacterized protein M6B38_223700 [Iris pallida]|uniref:Uncharacterized protein n=1 Tax=Iris pallida TaxID=29817 RepID=A0AAX6DVT3_IRIPA|nr:Uncharacterized protein M6B38_223700 [Iris pallida]